MPLQLPTQRHLFDIPDDLAWINCAANSPALASVYQAGQLGLKRKRHPWTLGPAQFQDDVARLRGLFADLIGASADDISLAPSASYGLTTAAHNLTIGPGRRVLVLATQFPSHIYPWRHAVARDGGEVTTLPRPADNDWTQVILDALDETVAVLALPQCHWTDGSLVDLARIAPAAHEVGAALVLDLSQSLGVVPFDVGEIQPDFVCTVAFKWLLGPYTFAFLYSAPHHQGGAPLEHTWSNRADSDVAEITDYRDDFLSGGRRYDMGERGNYIAVPMAIAGLEQVLAWDPASIALSLSTVVDQIAERAETMGLIPTPKAVRAPHMIGLRFPDGPPVNLIESLKADRVFVSQRTDCLRISPHLYNNQADLDRLFKALAKSL
ncbi:MAG: aminotransferase class V-fold PLP-dependent enzyme [Alphaproteobacteria bacterium]|jgi:selenocysteine lyase/cysteine desulfurase